MKLYMKSTIFSLLALSLLTTGCLKDKDYEDGKIQSTRGSSDQKIVELGLTATSSSNYLPISLNSSNSDTVFDIVPVILDSGNPATEDIKVTLSLNPALIGNYNALNGTTNEDAPSSVYEIQSPTDGNGGYVVTIPKGSNKAFMKIKIVPSDFLGHAYALGFQITKIEPAGYLISTNFGFGVVSIGIKNKYDGVYTIDASSSLVDAVAPSLSSVPGDPYPFDVYLVTQTANSNVMFVPGLGYGHLIAGNSYYGEFSPVFKFDTNTDAIIAVNNYFGDPSPGRARSGELDPAGLNKVNADKSIDVQYLMKQSGSPRTTFIEHMTYVGPRP